MNVNCYLTITNLFRAKVKLSSAFQNHKKVALISLPFPRRRNGALFGGGMGELDLQISGNGFYLFRLTGEIG